MGGQFGKAFDRLGSTGRVVMVLIAVVTVAAVAYLVRSAKPASTVAAYTNLDPKDAGTLQATLADAGISAELADGGRTIRIPGAKVAEAKVAVAASGVNVGGHEGWELVEKQGIGTTERQEQANFQRAIAGNLATAIEKIQGVRKATVNLALPERAIFTEDQRQPAASVVVDTGGGQLPDETIRGVIRLVASGVPGLVPARVTMTNERGELLSTTENGIGDAASSRLSAEAAWNRRKTGQAQAVLDTVLGPGMATVVVTGTLNFDQVQEKRQDFGKKVGDLTSRKEEEKMTPAQGGPRGAAGTPTNVPGTPAAAETTAGTGSAYSHTESQGTSALPTTVTETTKAGGDPKGVSIALALSKDALPKLGLPADASEAQQTEKVEALEAQLRAVVGAKATDPVETIVSAAAFPKIADTLKNAGVVGAAPAATGDPLTSMLGPFGVYLKPALALVGLLIFLFLVRRSLSRRQALLATTDASWLPALEAPPIRIEELMPAGVGPSEAELAGHHKKQLQGRIEEIATTRPSDVAQQLRGWLSSDS